MRFTAAVVLGISFFALAGCANPSVTSSERKPAQAAPTVPEVQALNTADSSVLIELTGDLRTPKKSNSLCAACSNGDSVCLSTSLPPLRDVRYTFGSSYRARQESRTASVNGCTPSLKNMIDHLGEGMTAVQIQGFLTECPADVINPLTDVLYARDTFAKAAFRGAAPDCFYSSLKCSVTKSLTNIVLEGGDAKSTRKIVYSSAVNNRPTWESIRACFANKNIGFKVSPYDVQVLPATAPDLSAPAGREDI